MFRRAKRRTTGRRNFEQSKAGVIYQSSEFSSLYKTRLSFYDVPPLEEITIEEFETWAIDRLKVLIEIESCVARSKSLKDIEAVVKPLLLKYLSLSPDSGSNQGHVMNERRKDHYSHYILRLVFCRSDELRRKFIKNETILFKVRYNMMQPKEQQEFIETNKDRLPWLYISNEEKTELLEDLFHASGSSIKAVLAAESGDPKMNISLDSLMQHIKSKENFIKLPFTKVPNLVASRQTLIRKGQAYIPSILQLNLLSIEFQDALSRDLLRTFQAIPRLEDDDRILPLLNNLSYNFSNIQYESSYANDSSLASDINAQSVTTPEITKHFPLCALHLQKNVVLNSHLRYQGRQQLGLFLKGIGLNVDEALKFWSYQFTKSSSSMSIEKYNKEYKYNVRHMYGLEGARIHYKPWDCARILLKPKPGKGEYHGCPYRDMSVDALVSNLNDLGVTDQVDLNNVIDDVGRNDYTVACTRVFEITHKKQLDRNKALAEALHISHPNLYFDRSRQLARLDSKAIS